MTPEAQNIAIAQSLGWHGRTVHGQYFPMKGDLGVPPDKPEDGFFQTIPNYHSSLDACAEFEAALAGSDDGHGSRWRYIQELIEVTVAECMEIHRNVFTVVHSTAPQRCEAYLRTIGKWEESK